VSFLLVVSVADQQQYVLVGILFDLAFGLVAVISVLKVIDLVYLFGLGL